jgi:hypothetical protein
VVHLGVVQFALQLDGLSAAQKAVAQLRPDGLEWQSAVKRELEIPLGLDAKTLAAMAQIVPIHVSALSNPSILPKLQEMRTAGSQRLRDVSNIAASACAPQSHSHFERLQIGTDGGVPKCNTVMCLNRPLLRRSC